MASIGNADDKSSQLDNVNKDSSKVGLTLSQFRQLAIDRHRRGYTAQAIKLYQTLLRHVPEDVGIWTNLGTALRKQKHYQAAVNCYRRALEIKPEERSTQGNLANALKDLHRLDEALALHRHLVETAPNDVQARMNYACALREAGRFDQALAQLDHAQSRAPDDAGIEWERAQNLLYLGRYLEGWAAYEARWRIGELPLKNFGCPQWQGEDIQGKTIVLHAEQGYGDTLLAVRYVTRVKQCVGAYGRVLLQCKTELHRLLSEIGADQLLAPDQMPSAPDFHCPLMSLMGCFQTEPDSIPEPARLHVPNTARAKFSFLRNQHPGKIKLGLVWSGSITFKNNENRALPLAAFLPLGELPGVRLYSLQKGPRLDELHRERAQAYIEDLGQRCDDFADTAAAIENLDAIVMTDSSVAHLAASLGKPVINIVQRVPYWLYALRKDSTPWYSSMRLIEQPERGHWDDLRERVGNALRNLPGSTLRSI